MEKKWPCCWKIMDNKNQLQESFWFMYVLQQWEGTVITRFWKWRKQRVRNRVPSSSTHKVVWLANKMVPLLWSLKSSLQQARLRKVINHYSQPIHIVISQEENSNKLMQFHLQKGDQNHIQSFSQSRLHRKQFLGLHCYC